MRLTPSFPLMVAVALCAVTSPAWSVDCAVAQHPAKNVFYWPVFKTALVKVTRDGVLLTTSTTGIYTDTSPLEGNHMYCASPVSNPAESCCVTVTTLPSNTTCSASSDQVGKVTIHWSDSIFETGYRLYRDDQVATELPENDTSYVDVTSGSHTYCVEPFNFGGNAGRSCCQGTAIDIPPIAVRLSWNSCSPQITDQDFAGPGSYTLVVSAFGTVEPVIGHDSQILIHPVFDAWRFDEGGCQDVGRLHLSNAGLLGCPAMAGANPLPITSYAFLDGVCNLRLALSFDDFVTDPSQRYLLWKIVFDHSHSVPGTDADPTTCDDADRTVQFDLTARIGLTDGHVITGSSSPGEATVFWNGLPVAAKPMTWGRLKGLYR